MSDLAGPPATTFPMSQMDGRFAQPGTDEEKRFLASDSCNRKVPILPSRRRKSAKQAFCDSEAGS